MSVKKFLDPAVDPTLDVIRCPRYFRMTNERKKMRQAVLNKASNGSEFFMSVPPASLFVLHISVASLGKETMVFSPPVFPAMNPAAFLSPSSNCRQLFDEPTQILSSHGFRM